MGSTGHPSSGKEVFFHPKPREETTVESIGVTQNFVPHQGVCVASSQAGSPKTEELSEPPRQGHCVGDRLQQTGAAVHLPAALQILSVGASAGGQRGRGMTVCFWLLPPNLMLGSNPLWEVPQDRNLKLLQCLEVDPLGKK